MPGSQSEERQGASRARELREADCGSSPGAVEGRFSSFLDIDRIKDRGEIGSAGVRMEVFEEALLCVRLLKK